MAWVKALLIIWAVLVLVALFSSPWIDDHDDDDPPLGIG